MLSTRTPKRMRPKNMSTTAKKTLTEKQARPLPTMISDQLKGDIRSRTNVPFVRSLTMEMAKVITQPYIPQVTAEGKVSSKADLGLLSSSGRIGNFLSLFP